MVLDPSYGEDRRRLSRYNPPDPLTGSALRPRSVEEKAAIARDLRAHVWRAAK
jgi:hypothetical protein